MSLKITAVSMISKEVRFNSSKNMSDLSYLVIRLLLRHYELFKQIIECSFSILVLRKFLLLLIFMKITKN